MRKYEIVIIGGGPAGLAAALAARENGAGEILILERDSRLGGILNQCIHNGFGLHTFREELTGPEYADRFLQRVLRSGIETRCGSMVIRIDRDRTVTYVNRREGIVQVSARAVILAMGCRERPRGALNIPGYRPAGIYSAGTAQRLVNLEGVCVGKRAVILGSGDIGLIMARRLTLEGTKVLAVAEIMPYSGGLKRNIVQCLDDFGIPLLLSHTVVEILGKKRVEGVVLAQVDENRKPIPQTRQLLECDTLLLSVGLLPENELTEGLGAAMDRVTGGPRVNQRMETEVPGIFACGNVLHVHDLVDYVSQEAALAGREAALWVQRQKGKEEAGGSRDDSPQNGAGFPSESAAISLRAGKGIRYTVPQHLDAAEKEEGVTVRFRVDGVYRDSSVAVYCGHDCIRRRTKRIFAPGEIEQLVLTKEQLKACRGQEEIEIRVEDAGRTEGEE